MWIRVGGVKSGRLINFIVLPLGSAMVIDPMDLMCNHHLTPTRGGMETVNRNLNGAEVCIHHKADAHRGGFAFAMETLEMNRLRRHGPRNAGDIYAAEVEKRTVLQLFLQCLDLAPVVIREIAAVVDVLCFQRNELRFAWFQLLKRGVRFVTLFPERLDRFGSRPVRF